MREYAIAHQEQNSKRMVYLFSKYLPIFYVATSIIACFIASYGDWLAQIVGGDDFEKAAFSVMILGIAPIHQTYGQLSGSLMTATDRTNEYGKISIVMTVLGLPFTYFMLAPESYWGLNLGATGLALKLVIIQVIGVNVQIWYNTRYLSIQMKNLVIHQIIIFVLFMLFALTIKIITGKLLGFTIISLIVSGLIYILSVFMLLLIFPKLICMTRSELKNLIRLPLQYLRNLYAMLT